MSRIDSLRLQDDPWRRLTWQTPLAVVVTLLALMGFVRVLEPPAGPFKALRPLDVQVLEAPASVRAPTTATAQRPAAPVRRSPPPKPAPEKPKPEPVPPPVPEPRVETPTEPPPAPRAVAPEPPAELASAATARVLESAPMRETSAPPSPPVSSPVSPPTGPVPPTPEAAQRPAVSGPPIAAVPPLGTGSPGAGLGGGRMGARAIYQPLPEIPEALRRRAVDFVAVARFRVAANGTAQVELTQPTADPELNRALVDTLKRWRFFPATQDGKPIASTLDIRIPISVR